jgi:hypothetical protein
VAFLSSWEIHQEIALGFVRQMLIPGLHMNRTYSWAVSSGDLGGLAGEFYHFANSMRGELIPSFSRELVPGSQTENDK